MKTTSAVSLFAAAVLGLSACTVQVTPAVPGGPETDAENATTTPEAAPTSAEETTPEVPEPTEGTEAPASAALPELFGPDGTPLPVGAALTTREAAEASLASAVAADFDTNPAQLDGAVDSNGAATILVGSPDGAEVYWPMAGDGTNPQPVEAFTPGMPGVAVAPGMIAGGTSPDSLPDWSFAAVRSEGALRTLTSDEFEGYTAEQPVLDADDLWVFLVGQGGSILTRVPLLGGDSEPFGVWAQFGSADAGVTALATTWSHPDLDGFEVHHLARGVDETLLSGSAFVGDVTNVASSGDVTAMTIVAGDESEPSLVVVDGDRAVTVDMDGLPVAVDAAGRYVAWAEATTWDGGPVNQYLLDLDTDTVTSLGQGAPTTSLPALSDTSIAWSVTNADGTSVLTATLP